MIETDRLLLRAWRDDDGGPFQRICSDPQVMATLGPPLDMAATEALVARMQALQAEYGHCFWALERREDARLVGWCGVIRGTVGPVEGKAEIGWRLASDCWGAGYATEAARAAVDWVFAHLPDDAVWAITAEINHRSRAVMERLRMTHRAELGFAHPKVAQGDRLQRHVTYSLDRSAWASRR
ncbi:MAG: GNAT family N-acetyltransferase [Novosphingobium sp.]|nr:GNAT family N-acetyltransferase [Novosphingobium sp.]